MQVNIIKNPRETREFCRDVLHVRVDGSEHAGSIYVLDDFICSKVERIDWKDWRRSIVGLSFLCRYARRWSYAWSEMDECGKRSNSWDVFLTLYIFLCFVYLVLERVQRAKRVKEASDSPAPELGPTLVLVLGCLTVAPLVCPPMIAQFIKLHTIGYSDTPKTFAYFQAPMARDKYCTYMPMIQTVEKGAKVKIWVRS